MKNEKALEKIYDLVETTDFNDLKDEDRKFVLQYISMEEYMNMRLTITDTKDLFSKYPDEPDFSDSSVLKKFFTYPVQLYQVAALIIVVTCLYIFLNNQEISGQSKILASIDTVFIKQIDTVVVNNTETTDKKVEHINHMINRKNKEMMSLKKTDEEFKQDCLKEICPDDINKLINLKTKNTVSEDFFLSDFIVPIN